MGSTRDVLLTDLPACERNVSRHACGGLRCGQPPAALLNEQRREPRSGTHRAGADRAYGTIRTTVSACAWERDPLAARCTSIELLDLPQIATVQRAPAKIPRRINALARSHVIGVCELVRKGVYCLWGFTVT